MKKHFWPFISFWVLDSILLYVAAWLYPFYFTLGNKSISALWAAVAAGLVWTFLEWISKPVVSLVFKLKGEVIMFGFYFLTNFIALWITGRLAPVAGFGVTSFVWLVFLALIANFFQWGLWKLGDFKKMLK